jgi:signal transduction histidine kinase
MEISMNDDPILQLPEPYRAAWNVLHEAGDLENILTNILENAKVLAHADWAMIVLKSDFSSYSYFLPFVRTLPDTTQGTFGDRNVSLVVYLLARRAMRNKGSEMIPDTSVISLQDKQHMVEEFLRETTINPSRGLNAENEGPQFLLLVPILSEQDVVGTMVLSRPIQSPRFTAKHLAEVELFVALIAKYLSSIVRLSDLVAIDRDIFPLMVYETHPSLVSIRGYADLLLRAPEYGQLNDDQRNFVMGIRKFGKHLKQIIANLYYLSQLEADQIRFGREKYDVSEIVLRCYQQIKVNFEEKKQSVNLGSGERPMAEGDGSRIEYVVETLMKNACSYSPKESNISVLFERRESFVCVLVSDHGIGLTGEEKNHLFQRFYRSDRTEVRENLGIGLELFISKQFIELMGGQIGADGSENQGSTFWFTLPIATE